MAVKTFKAVGMIKKLQGMFIMYTDIHLDMGCFAS